MHVYYKATCQAGARRRRGIAPDAKPAARWRRGNKTQFTFSIAPELLERIDEVAHRKHLSRAALLNVWINDRLEQETT